MERVIQVLNRMQSGGVVENYAIGGGIAALMDSGKIDMNVFRGIVKKHGLEDKWNRLLKKFELEE